MLEKIKNRLFWKTKWKNDMIDIIESEVSLLDRELKDIQECINTEDQFNLDYMVWEANITIECLVEDIETLRELNR